MQRRRIIVQFMVIRPQVTGTSYAWQREISREFPCRLESVREIAQVIARANLTLMSVAHDERPKSRLLGGIVQYSRMQASPRSSCAIYRLVS
jgi:hypothetical protein